MIKAPRSLVAFRLTHRTTHCLWLPLIAFDQKKSSEYLTYPSFHSHAIFSLSLNRVENEPCTINKVRELEPLRKFLHSLLNDESFQGTSSSYATLLRYCCDVKALSEGRLVHARLIKDGLGGHRYLGNLLITMYRKCKSPKDAIRVFVNLCERDLASWTGAIASHMELGHIQAAFRLLDEMKGEGLKADKVAYLSILKAFPCRGTLSDCKHLHAEILREGCDQDLAVATALVNMYGKCGSWEDAYSVFTQIHGPNLISWNSIIGSCARCGKARIAFELYGKMISTGVKPNVVTLVNLLNACVNPEFLAAGKKITARLIEDGYQLDVIVQTALLNMYSKCGSLEDAWAVFQKMSERNVISWSAMISACARHGASKLAVEIFDRMEREQVRPNAVSYANIFYACANPEALARGKLIHSGIMDSEFESDLVVGTAIMNMYGKCGSLTDARIIFDKMPQRNVVSWNALIAAYTQHGYGKEALELFKQMQLEGLCPDKSTLVSILDSCANVALLETGRLLHAWVIENILNSEVDISTAILNMYGKCGELKDALGLFNEIVHRDAISWNALIAAYAQHGEGVMARNLFGQMQWEGSNPTQVSLVSILSVCSHAGLTEEGFQYFTAIGLEQGVIPSMDHYACMVDLLGRSGRLKDACEFVRTMPFKPAAVVWMTLLGACRVYKDVELGKWVADRLLELDNQNGAPYVILSNIYAAADRWQDVARLRTVMAERCSQGAAGSELKPQCISFM